MTDDARRAVFLDRDGTLCREVGYVNVPERLELMPDAAASLRRLRERGWACVVVTNQAGIARGYFPQHVLEDTHRRLCRLLADEGASLDAIYACHHHPDVGAVGFRRRCGCRKPAPGMLLRAAQDLGLCLEASYMVGDSFKDVGAGRAAGVRGCVMLRSGYGRGELLYKEPPPGVWPDFVADDLPSAVDWILKEAERE